MQILFISASLSQLKTSHAWPKPNAKIVIGEQIT